MSTPLCCPTAALDVALLVASHPPKPELICLCLDQNHQGGSSFVVTNAPRDLAGLTTSLVRVVPHMPWVRAVVLALVIPQAGMLPSAAEQVAFLDAREQFDLEGVELLDWFLLDNGLALSLAELTDARGLWRRSVGCASCGAAVVVGPA